MEAIVESTLERLDREGKKNAELRSSIASAKEKLKREGEWNAEDIVEPLLLACRSGQTKLMVLALDCLQKLMSYGFLRGNRNAREAGIEAAHEWFKVIDVVVQTICACEDSDGKSTVPDDAVQLQVLKALVTAVTSCSVHETSLLSAVRACYHIHLYSRNPVNKTTAKATLTQIMNAVFQQMELAEAKIEKRNAQRKKDSEVIKDQANGDVGQVKDEGRAEETKVPSALDENMYPSVAAQLAIKVGKTDLPPGTSQDDDDDKVSKTSSGSTASQPFRSIYHKDAYFLFRALCKLSMRAQSDGVDSHGVDPIALRSKVLSLDLLLNILDNSGPGFRNGRDFIIAVKKYLCPSLIKNCLSSNTQVVGISLRIFVVLQNKFSRYLKAEIEVVISKIFLSILESSNSPHEHKVLVLEVLLQLSKDVETLVSIFLNYDCDWDSIDLYSRIVQLLSKLASETPSAATLSGNGTAEEIQHSALHAMSLKSIVSIVESLAEFTHFEDSLPSVNGITSETNPTSNNNNNNNTSSDTPLFSPSTADSDNAEDASRNPPAEDELASTVGAPKRQSSVHSRASASISGDTTVNGGATPSSRKLKVDSFQQKQKYMRDMESAASKFNIKPKRGIEFLVEQGYIDNTPEDVASALLQFQDKFSKTMIGDFLGEDKDFNVQTLHCYVEQLSFKNMLIDDALRVFLAGFRLPGEAQKIDRMMEKFAAKYIEGNPNSFPSADVAFVLAFSVIMLQTDLHNPNIAPEKKMTKQAYLNMNRGIAGGRDLDPEFLGGIYDRIKGNAISLKEDDGARAKLAEAKQPSAGIFGSSKEALYRQKRVAFSKEREEIVQIVTSTLESKNKNSSNKPISLLKARSNNTENADPAVLNGGATEEISASVANSVVDLADVELGAYLYDSNEHVRPMFAVTWAPFCATFSVNMQNAEEYGIVNLVVRGMRSALRIACRFGMEDERKTLFDALIKFTLLNTNQEMKQKHIDCTQALIDVVQHEGDYLGSSWVQALTCFSQLARMQLYTGGSSDGSMSATSPGSGSQNARRRFSASRRKASQPALGVGGTDGSIFSYFQTPVSPEEQARMTDEDNAARLLKSVDMIQIDRIFLDSVNLNTAAIVDMVHALCEVSSMELRTETGSSRLLGRLQLDNKPRIFSLQKIVEVADSNMDTRPRFVWGRIWQTVSEHFSLAGRHPDVGISMYAVDSLRQLSVKFLEKDELAGFNFQHQFMQPFENMIALSKSPELRDLVLRCLENIILSRSQHLRSGWRIMLNAVSIGGTDTENEVSSLAFSILERVVRDHLEAVSPFFTELIKCLQSFASNASISLGLSERAIDLLERALDEVFGHGRPAIHNMQGATKNSESMTKQEASRKAVLVGHFDKQLHGVECFDKVWPLVCVFCSLMGDTRPDVRSRARKGFLSRLEREFVAFSPATWVLLFHRALFALLAQVKSSVRPVTVDTYDRVCEAEAVLNAAIESRYGPVEEGALSETPVPVSMSVLFDSPKSSSSTFHSLLDGFTGLLAVILKGETGAMEVDDAEALEAWKAQMENEVRDDLLQLVLFHLEYFSLLDMEACATTALGSMCKILRSSHSVLDEDGWTVTCKSFENLLTDSTPKFLIAKETRTWLSLDEIEGKQNVADNRHVNGIDGRISPTYATDMEEEEEEEDNDDEEEEEGNQVENGQPDVVVDKQASGNGDIKSKTSKKGKTKTVHESGKNNKKKQRSLWYKPPQSGDALPFSSSTSFVMCSLHLQVLQAIGSVISENLSRIPADSVLRLLASIRKSIDFAHDFNDDLSLRIELQKRGFMQGPGPGSGTVPTLLRQETLALEKYLKLLFKLDLLAEQYEVKLDDDAMVQVRSSLEQSLHKLFMHYLFQDRMYWAEFEQHHGGEAELRRRTSGGGHEESETEVDLRFFTPIVLLSLREVQEWKLNNIRKNLSWLYPLLTALMDCGNREVHAALRQIFDSHISNLLGLGVEQ